MIDLISSVFKLVVLVVGEIYAAKKAAREAQEKWELDTKTFLDATDKAITKFKEDAKIDSDKAKNVDDIVDRELKK